MNGIIQRIRDLMAYKGLNISDTAKSVGITQPNLSSMLAGKRPIGDNVLNKFVLAFNVNKKWLVSGDGDMLQKDSIIKFDVSKTKFEEQLEKMISTINYVPSVSTPNLYKLLDNILKGVPKEQVEDVFKNSKSLQEFYDIIGEKKHEPIPFDRTRIVTEKTETRPRIPYTAVAGTLTSAVEGVTSDLCEQIPRITAFPNYDFTIIIKGNSMEPKYEGGDEVACKRVDSTSFIQWGKVHVMDTAQGIIIKRVYEDGEKIRCTSYNPEYPDFSICKNEIYSMSLVVGLLRM